MRKIPFTHNRRGVQNAPVNEHDDIGIRDAKECRQRGYVNIQESLIIKVDIIHVNFYKILTFPSQTHAL